MANRANERKYHYIYKITRNDGSGKYYIGMHSTDDLEDGYFGSGQLLWKSIKKHGKEKHSKEILEHLSSREALKFREKQIVNEELLGDKLCMNLKLGGEGGWDHVPREIVLENLSKRNPNWKHYNGSELARKNSSENMKRVNATHNFRHDLFKGKSHSEETKRVIGEANSKMTGEKNSQFGSKWMNKDGVVKKIKHNEVEQCIQDGWRLGRKI
jgi:hypothetical protein